MVAKSQFEVKIAKFKFTDPICWTQNSKNVQGADHFEKILTKEVFWAAEFEFAVKCTKVKVLKVK